MKLFYRIKQLQLSHKAVIYLNRNNPNKIHIIGSVGSGKTTLARNLSRKINVPYYELDNVVWKRHKSEDIRRSDEERDEYLNTIIRTDRWIIEGAHNHEWVFKSFQNADLIIFLDTPYAIRIIRITKRFILQKLGIEKANYKPTFTIFKKMFEWNAGFEKKLRQYN
ncbi:DNA topology modulation protein [Paenibacillus marchantiophytorum]|uniref:DNA topology modulation protein n=1 Tax=Paenibacillus marchantiophytorum TaxID=1619310 RepID=A0ABQ2BPQ0_9BACL|nr:DNA topology modulation protein [Paenibacillus marchantiophytorum]